MRKLILFFGIFLFFIFILGCAANKKLSQHSTVQKNDYSQRLAGVDSVLAHNARIKSEHLFVDLKSQNLADSLLTYGYDFLVITEELFVKLTDRKKELAKHQDDVQKFEQELKQKKEQNETVTLQQERKLGRMTGKYSEDSLTITIVSSLLEYFLDHCEETFQRSIELDPFNLRCYQLHARGNWDRGLMFEDTSAHRKSVHSLIKFLEHDKGYPRIYRDLGRNYYQLKEWEHAYEYISRAFNVLKITSSYFEENKPKLIGKYEGLDWLGNIDPLKYYDYINDKANAEIKAYLADSALASLEKAYILAPTKTDSLRIKQTTEWILWDDGNLRALEQIRIITDSLNNKKYSWARGAYVRLIPQLNTKKAKDDVNWRISRLDYHFLDRHETAASRLYRVIVNSDTNKATPNFYEPPNDSMYRVYFKDCGQMFYDLGLEFQKRGLFNKARSFLVSDTTIDWSGRAKSFIYLAQLSLALNLSPAERKNLPFEQIKQRARRNQLLAVKLLNRALDLKSGLKRKEIDFAYNQLIDLWKQINPKKVPAIFQEYRRYIARFGNKSSG